MNDEAEKEEVVLNEELVEVVEEEDLLDDVPVTMKILKTELLVRDETVLEESAEEDVRAVDETVELAAEEVLDLMEETLEPLFTLEEELVLLTDVALAILVTELPPEPPVVPPCPPFIPFVPPVPSAAVVPAPPPAVVPPLGLLPALPPPPPGGGLQTGMSCTGGSPTSPPHAPPPFPPSFPSQQRP